MQPETIIVQVNNTILINRFENFMFKSQKKICVTTASSMASCGGLAKFCLLKINIAKNIEYRISI